MTNLPITINAPAKINLYLHVTGHDDDTGYHALDSIFMFTDVHDVLSLSEKISDETLIITGAYADDLIKACPNFNDNIILKSAHAFAQFLGKSARDLTHYQFNLIKNIPLGAGLGGGSSNAAASIKLLMRVWNVRVEDLDKTAFDDMLFNLGADVPTCFYQKTTQLKGAGKELSDAPEWLNNKQLHGVLIYPNAHNDTAAIFKEYKKQGAGFSPALDITATNLTDLMAQTGNDLTRSAIALCPNIQNTLSALNAQSPAIPARMSGSGSSVFALFNSNEVTQDAATKLQQANPNWWVQAFSAL